MADYLRESGVKWLWEKIKTLLSAKQDNLVSGTNIKTINGTSLLGSGDIAIEGGDSTGDVDEGRLVWSQETILDNTTILDAIMRDTNGNKIAFMNRGGIQIEYSRDNGGTWIDYGADNATKTQLVTPIVGFAQLALGGRHTNDATALTDRLRVTLDAIEGDFYFRINKILIQVENGVNLSAKFMVDIEYKTYGGSDWIAYKTSQLAGSPGWSSIPVSNLPAWGYKSNPNIRYIRFTFRQEAFIQYKGRLRNIAIIGLKNTTGGNNLTNKGTIYSLDIYQNAVFPEALKAKKLVTTGGKSTQVVMGDGSLIPLSELSPITDADAEILLDNHIHSIDVNTNGNYVNISVIESSKNGNNWETEDNDIPIPLATTTSAGMMSKEDKIKSDGLLIYYHLTEDEYNNHEIVSLYPLVLAIKDTLFDSSTNKWKYDDSKTYDVRVKGWTLQDNGITYLNVNVRLLTSQGGHSIGFSGFVDVDFITETYFDAIIPLYIGYICGKYHIENDGMTIVAPEDSGFYIEI